MTGSLRALVLAVVVPSTIAVADPAPSPGTTAQPTPDSLPDGLTIELHDQNLEVHKDNLSAVLVRAVSLTDVKFDRKTSSVTVEYEDTCNFDKFGMWNLARLEAMPAFADAVARKTRHDDKGAAAAFTRAAAQDPTWVDPVYGLAAVQLHAGDPDAAERALGGLLTTAPIATYLHVTSDPELSALSARPAIQAVRAKPSGTVAVTSKGITGTVAISPDHKWLAVAQRDDSGFSSSFELNLLVLDAATGRVVSQLPLVDSHETDFNCYDEKCSPILAKARQAVDRRAKAREKALRELGFRPAKVEAAKLNHSQDPDSSKGSFPRAKLGLEMQGSNLQISRLSTSVPIATGSISGKFTDEIVYVEESHTILVWSSYLQSEAGCNQDRRPNMTLISVPPAR